MGAVTGKRVLLAKPRGYCAGVDRAVQTVEEALKLYGPPIYVRKEIVHNKHVVSTLQAQGAIFVEENEEVPEGSIVIFSAHGVAPEVYEQARTRNLRAIDATCPLVTKVHQEAKRFAAEDYDILLIGHEGHEEVVGTAGEAPRTYSWWTAPTAPTRSPCATRARSSGCPRPRCRWTRPWKRWPGSSSGCRCCSPRPATTSATPPPTASTWSRRSRRSATWSSWSVPGTRPTRSGWPRSPCTAGAPAAYLVDYAHEIRDEWLDGAATVGLTSGASVPDELVMQVLDHLAERGFDEVAEFTTAQETLTFSLPQALKRDMRTAAAQRAGSAATLAATVQE